MAHFNEIVVKTAKTKKNTKKAVLASLADAYPGYEVRDIVSEDNEWKATLLKELTSDEVSKLSAMPFEEEVEEEEIEEPEEDAEEEIKESEGDEEGVEDSTSEEQLKDVMSLLQELISEVRKLKEKADMVDEIHESTKPHAAPKPEDIGPTPGGPGPVGIPGKPASTKIAYASIEQDGFEFSMSEVAEAMQQKYAGYEVVDMKKDIDNNRYIAKLVSK